MSYRRSEQQPPDGFRRVSDQAGHRLAHVFEVEPSLMTEHVRQQQMPVWDTQRIVESRVDHLEWMHRHWADVPLSGDELLAELDGADPPPFPHIPNHGPSTSETRS
jgi:hypothetical protein